MNQSLSRFLILAVCMIYASYFADAQCPAAGNLDITPTLYSQENGLASNMLMGIAKDSMGYRYFLGINKKWIRYDGVNFDTRHKYDSIPLINHGYSDQGFTDGTENDYVEQRMDYPDYKYQKTKNGSAYRWSYNFDSLIWMDAYKNKRLAFKLPASLGAYPYIYWYPVEDTCWITSANQVFRFDLPTKTFSPVATMGPKRIEPPGKAPMLLFIRPGDGMYLLTSDGLLRMNRRHHAFEPFAAVTSGSRLNRIGQLIMGNYIMAAEWSSIKEIDLTTGLVSKIELADYSETKNLAALEITNLANFHNYLMIGTANAGLFIFNRCTRVMQHFQYDKQSGSSSPANSVIWLAEDDKHVVWMQTGAGLIKLEVNDKRMSSFSPSSVKQGGICSDCCNIRALYCADGNSLLIGAIEGLYHFDLNTRQFTLLRAPTDNKPIWDKGGISSITGDGKGNVFIGDWSNNCVLLLNKGRKKLVNILPKESRTGTTYTNFRCLLYDSNHVLWVGTNEGVVRISNIDDFIKNNYTGPLKTMNYLTGKDGTPLPPIGDCFTIAEDKKGHVWLGTANGLYIYDDEIKSLERYNHMPRTASSISDDDVRSICISSDNEAWIGTNNGGLNRFDLNTKTFIAVTTANGLPNNSIYSILEDNNGFLWLGTNAGLCRFNKKDNSVRTYTPKDGIQNMEFNTNAVTVIKDGRFCFGGRTGFNLFHPDSMNAAFPPPPVVITRIRVFDRDFPVTEARFRLSHEENSLTFDFATLNYYRSNDNQYAYMMEDADKDWVKAGNRQYASYTNLAPGSYTFKVKAANYTGMWNNQITAIQFAIRPAWYNSWWFRLAVLLLAGGGIYALYRYQLRQVLKLHGLRNRIASDLHDEIGSTLSSISLSTALIQNRLQENHPEVDKLLQQVSNNTENMLEALNDIVWAINTTNDRFDNVVNRMRAFAIEILDPIDILIEFNTSVTSKDIQLDMEQRKNLYLIFKEAVNNIAKYAQCKNVWIDLEKNNGNILQLKIKDDGKGFDISGGDSGRISLSGNGIANMRKRAQELKGQIDIKSKRNQGTEICLRFYV